MIGTVSSTSAESGTASTGSCPKTISSGNTNSKRSTKHQIPFSTVVLFNDLVLQVMVF